MTSVFTETAEAVRDNPSVPLRTVRDRDIKVTDRDRDRTRVLSR
jgi:hypothetical protein